MVRNTISFVSGPHHPITQPPNHPITSSFPLDTLFAACHTDSAMPKVTVYITLKPSLLDAQGRTIESALHSLGFEETANVRVGKIIQMDLPSADAETLRSRVTTMCDKLLANPVMESYQIDIAEGK